MDLKIVAATLCLGVLANSAAQGVCIEAADPADPDIQVMRCPDGVLIAAEATAARSSAARVSEHPRVLQLDAGALAVAQSTSDTFEVLTPDAVVTGRGSESGVAVAGGRTQVAVSRGQATLRRRWDNHESLIGVGDASQGAAGGFARLHDALRRAAD